MTVEELLVLIADVLGDDETRHVDVADLQVVVEVLALANPDLPPN